MSILTGLLPESKYYVSAAAAAIGSHALFQFHEPKPVDSFLFAIVVNALIFVYRDEGAVAQGFSIWKLNAVYLTTLLTSIFIYRKFFHRCRSFPGPFWAGATRFWAVATVNSGEYHRTLLQLHKEHGDYIRVGPREIDICNVDAINPIFGSKTKCVKGPWYEGTLMGGKERFLQNETSTGHIWKRRIWEAGLNSNSIRAYEPRVLHFIQILVDNLKTKAIKGPVDIGLYMSFFTFDVMGDLSFGEGFDMMENGNVHDYMRIVQGFAKFNSIICSIPWCATIFAWLPKAEAATALFAFAAERVSARMKLGRDRKDIFSHLLVPDKVTNQKYNDKQLVAESAMLVIGGSDTTSSSLATILYYLMANPGKYAKLKEEIDAYQGPLNHLNVSKLAYLNAVVREALRLLPPIGGGMMHRTTPPEGLTIGDTFIPGNTNVGIGPLSMQRDARYFGQPDDFIPERWLDQGPLPFDRNAFLVFSHGPYSCVGKHLAYIELCDVTAAMIRNFDLSFDPKYDVSSYETSIKDSVISSRAHLPVILKDRHSTVSIQ